jgi:hypothetical protein
MVINIFTVTALDFSFTSPREAYLKEEFIVSITLDMQENYDVKVFVHNSEDTKVSSEEYISEIYDGQWSNPWFYLKEAYPEKSEYEIRVIDSPGNREICVRLRKSGTSSFDTECKPIEILEKVQDEKLEENIKIEKKKEKIEEEVTQEVVQDFQLSEITNDKILLNSKPPVQKNKLEISTKSEKRRIRIIYSFTALCILIIILLALRKL